MKVFKKIATFTCGAIALVCLAIGGAFTLETDVAHAASKGGYIVQGGSVRLVDDAHGAGVKFHVIMTLEEFDNYGTIDGDTLTLDSGYTTGTVILPYHLLKGDELTVGYVASNGARAHCEPTTNLWKRVTIGGIDYAESVVYLYNIPDTDYGTEIAVRGVIFKDSVAVKYTEQENGISMSFVADAEYNDKNTQLDDSQLESLHNEYLKKEVTIVANGATSTQTVDYLDYVSEEVVPERQADGDELVGFYTASGKEITFEEAVKNHMTIYARYRESIVLSDATPSFNLGDYKRNAGDTVKSMTFTAADGTTYDLGANPAAVTVDTLKTAYADHGEGMVTAVLNDGAKDYTLTLEALVVTADIADNTALQNLLSYNGNNGYAVSSTSPAGQTVYTIDGYYRLTSDMSAANGCASVDYSGTAGQGRQYGFVGTFDGLGHTISGGWASGGGLFGQIGIGACVKDVHIKSSYNHGGYVGILASLCFESVIENVTITVTSVSNHYDGDPTTAKGCITFYETVSTTFNNVTVNINGGTVKSLFGGASFGNYGGNVYNGLHINGSIDYMGSSKKTVDASTVWTQHTVADEIAAGGKIIYNGEGNWEEENVTLSGRQDFVLNGTTASTEFALDLEGHDKGYTVQSITFNGVNLGTNPDDLDVSTLKTSVSSHGEGNVIVTMLRGVTKKTVTVPALFITHEITTADEFLSTFALKTDNTYYTYPSIIGYFRLANDIGDASWVFANNNRYDRYNTHGFRGTFDGNGYTITGQTGNGGLFECIGAGALIKNLTIINTGHTGNAHKAVLALAVCGAADNPAVLENVNIKFQPVAETDAYLPWHNKSTGNSAQGWLTSWGVFGVTFRNVTIDASSIINRTNGYRLSSVFGRINNDCYEYSNGTLIPNTYESLILKGRFTYEDVDLSEMGCLGYDAIKGVVVTVADEIASGANIIFNDAGWTEKTVTLDGRQEFLMTDTSFSIDIGEYANQKIDSIKLGATDLGADVDDLDMLALRTNYASHGEKTIVVTCIDGKNKTTVNVPVLLLTKEISTESELMSMLTFTENNKYFDTTTKAIFGCFRLTADIYVSSWTNNPGTFTHADKTQGFRATLDGAGHTLSSYNAGAWGLFSSIGQGAVIKNVNITHSTYYNGGYAPILGNYIQGATLENVTITTNSTQNYDATKGESDKYTQMGYLAVNGASGSTFRNVTINTNGDIYTIFGGYSWKEYEKSAIGQNVYDNFVINATTVDYIGFGVDGSGNRTFVTIAEEQEDPNNYIIYNGDDGKDLADAEFTQAYDLVLNGENKDHTLDLGEYADLAVRSITLTTADGSVYDLGTDVSALDVSVINTKANYADHGEGATIVVETQKNFITFTNVTVVTYEITKATSFQDNTAGLFMFNDTNPYFDTETKTIDGYYTLGESISFWSTPNNSQIDGGLSYDNPAHGFIGTFDGRGYTLDNYASGQYGAASTRGFFGQLGIGAVVKNTNFIVNTYTHSQYSAVLATAAYSATFEDITVSTTTVTGHDGTVANYIGFLTTNSISGCTFNNVTVELNGQQIESLFGGRTSNGYEYDSKGGQNTYNNFVVNGTVDYMGTGASGNVTVKDEIFSGADITYNGKKFADFVEDVVLTKNQDIVLNGANAASKQSLDLGEYAIFGAKEITYHAASGADYDLGSNPSALNVSALQGNYADHGVGTVVVLTNYDTTITIPVTVVTAQIAASDLNQNSKGTFMFNGDNPYFNAETNTIDGYYTLGENISFWNTPNNVNGNTTNFDFDNVNQGFIGTFDGRGYTMTHTQAAQYGASTRGLFGQLGSGAVVKNVTMIITGYQHRQYESILGTSAYNATFENVTFEVAASGVSGYDGTTADARGFLTELSISGCTFNNVTVNLNGQHIVSLFGGRGSNGYEEDFSPGGSVYPGQNVYNNFVVNGTVDYIGTGHDLNKTKCNFTIEDEIKAGAGITYNGQTFANYLPSTNYLAAKDGSGNWYSDYTIVYDASNADIEELVDFLRDQIQRATGGVTYAKGSNGEFTETVGGLQLRKAAGATWHANARYIVIGNEEMRDAADIATPVTSGYDFTIQEVGNSVFIFSNNEEDYVSAILRFLEETIGYMGLSDDYVVYDNITGLDLATKLTATINGNVAFANRETTRGILRSKEEVLGVNARMSDVWSVMPDLPDSGVGHLSKDYYSAFHNSILWVPQAEAGSDAGNWFTDANDDGAYDLCYTAHGNPESYTRMVAKAAEKIYAKLVAAGASATKKVSVTFSIMDDWSVDACDCTYCAAQNDTALLLNFLTDVALLIEAQDSEMLFTIYTLAYHCYERPATTEQLNAAAAAYNYDSNNKKTILTDGKLNEHIGIIYAPAPSTGRGYTAAAAQSIYATVNDQIRANMAAWDVLTDNVGIWYYNTYFQNYMMPFGSFSSMLTWIEYAARLFEDDNVVWSFVQGQHSPRMTTGFDAFKTYMVQKAQIEILDKVDYNAGNYDTQIANYLLELEQEFFGFTGDGSAVGNFTDKGYYGPAAANYNMYQFYKQLKTNYTAMIGKNDAYKSDKGVSSSSTANRETMIGRTNEHYDYMMFARGMFNTPYYGKYASWLSDSSAKDKDTYMINWAKKTIDDYLGYVEEAMVAVLGMTDVNGNKEVYKQHVMLESLFPRFVICNGNHSSYWSGGYTTTAYHWSLVQAASGSKITLANMRSAFKTDCTALDITNYSEGGAMSAVYSKWGIS